MAAAVATLAVLDALPVGGAHLVEVDSVVADSVAADSVVVDSVAGDAADDVKMTERINRPGGAGARIRQPWTDGAHPQDWSDPKRTRADGRHPFKKGKRATPRAGGRTGPVRGARTVGGGHPKSTKNLARIGRVHHRKHRRR